MTIIKVICCYCGKFMRIKDGKGITGVSHSVCSECLEGQLKEIKNFKRKE